MKKDLCTYHPTRPALWHCRNCNAYFCRECIMVRPSPVGRLQTLSLCPKCEMPATRLGISGMIEPFWSRIPKFFLYPFNIRPLTLMIILSAVMAGLLFIGNALLYAFIILINMPVVLKYSFVALRRTAQGDVVPPGIGEDSVFEDFNIVFKLLFIYVTIGAAFGFLVGAFNPVIGQIGLNLLLFLLPSMVMVLATSNSFFRAVNPAYFVRLAVRMGPGYLIMCFFNLLLSNAPSFFIWALHENLPSNITALIYIIPWNYYTIVTFHLMGYAILQYHKEIGYEVEYEDRFLEAQQKASASGRQKPAGGLMNRVNIFIKEGKIEEAVKLIQQETRGTIQDLELAEKYYELLKISRKDQELLTHARDYLGLLSRSPQREKIFSVFRECTAINPDFNPGGKIVMKVANRLASGNPKGAINILNKFIKADPGDPEVPHAYLLAADIFTNQLMSPEKAVKILNLLRKKYSDHEISATVEQNLHKISLAYGIS